MIDENKLIADLMNNYMVKNDGTWNDAIDRAVELTKTAPKIDTEKEMQGKLNSLHDRLSKLTAENDYLHKQLAEMKENEKGLFELPIEPIACATMLIDACFEYDTAPILKAMGANEKSHAGYYEVDDLRQIAEHLLVYCNHQKDDENE